ncbi:MAG: electron transfer flavoprotein subunit beta/FixA family protein [Candidatus Bathyarchaeota archaeon]|nr:MAG: electron transfer flavoprotein subunit beta/FixA family protein [Candidatus Bathyarchaeota archaeon]
MTRILVCIKQALDVSQLKVDSTTRRIITADAPKKISDFDKNALEEAIHVKEKHGGEVFTVTVGPEDAKTTLREALAMGADKAYLISDPSFENSDTLATSYILAEAIKKTGPFDLILCGEASIDSFSAQVGPRLAERLSIPLITYARKLDFEGDVVTAERSLEDSSQTMRAKTPVLVTVTKEINEPRIPSLMAIMKASKKEIVIWRAADLSIASEKTGESGSAVQILDVLAPKTERKRIVIKGETPTETAEKLAKALVQEGVIGR